MTEQYSQKELETLRAGGQKLSWIMRQVGDYLTAGLTVHDLEMKTRELIHHVGAQSGTIGYKPSGATYPFPAAACISINDEVAHGIACNSDRIICEGDIVSIDVIIKYQGLFIDICRSYGVGKLSSEYERVLQAARQSTNKAIAQAVIGNTVDDIGRAAEQTAADYGCQTVRELGGHGVGKKIHMGPFIPNFAGSGFNDKIVEGAVLAIEPIISAGDWRIVMGDDEWVFRTKDGSVSAQFEETVLITKQGPEILTADALG